MKVLLDVRMLTQFRALVRVAELLRASGRYEPVFCMSDPGPDARRALVESCERAAFPWIDFHDEPPRHWSLPTPLVRIPQLGPILEGLPHAARAAADRRYAARFLERVEPALIVAGEDGMGANRPLLTAAARRGIPVLVVPYEFSTMRQPAEALRGATRYQQRFGMETVVNRALARLRPRWAHTDGDERLLRHLAVVAVAEELLGTAPRLPWSVHGGSASHVAVESQHMFEHYRSEGVAEEKLVITGALHDDELRRHLDAREALRRTLGEELGLDTRRRLVLTAMPPSYVDSRPGDFSTYAELVDFWLGTLRALPGVSALVQLHPAVTARDEASIAALGLPISRRDIATLIPACDLLVTSVSSIIRMAIACGVPVLNYDVYRFRFPDYAGVEGVITVEEPRDFAAWARDLATDDDVLTRVTNAQRAHSAQWGILDGHAHDRILALIDGLVA